MRTDDDVRRMLERRAADVHPSPDAWESITARMEERPVVAGRRRPAAPWLLAAAVVVVAGLVAAGVVVTRNEGGQEIEVGPAEEGTSTSTATYVFDAPPVVVSTVDGWDLVAFRQAGRVCAQLRRSTSDEERVCEVPEVALDQQVAAVGFGPGRITHGYGLVQEEAARVRFEMREIFTEVPTSYEAATIVHPDFPSVRFFSLALGRGSVRRLIVLDDVGNELGRVDLDAPGPGLTAESRVSITGIGPVRVGMTLEEAEAAGGVEITLEGTFSDPVCQYAFPETGPPGVAFMLSEGRIVRVDVDSEDVFTLSGAHIGMTEQEIMDLYPGQIEVSPHEYVEDGSYLTYVPVDPGDDQYRIVFETNGTMVTSIRAGQLPQVEYVEGCA